MALPRLNSAAAVSGKDSVVFLLKDENQIPSAHFAPGEIMFIRKQLKEKKNLVSINQYDRICFVYKIEAKKETHLVLEACRKNGEQVAAAFNRQKITSGMIADESGTKGAALAF